METQVHPHSMTNSHLLVHGFDYYEPRSVAEAVELLKQHGKSARLIAGGTHLLILMKMEREAPQAVISLGKIGELSGISTNEKGEMVIGASTTIREVRNSPEVQKRYPALAEACAAFGSTQIQIMGTIGGNLCNASPASDSVPALMIFDAQVVLQGPKGERRLPVEEFALKPGKTALQEGELLRAVVLPPPPAGAINTFLKISRVAADLAKASLAMLLVRDGERIADCRIAFGSVAPTVIRIKKAEARLKGQAFGAELVKEAGKVVEESVTPIDDVRSSAWYRRQIVNVMFQDVFNLLWQQAGQKKSGPLNDLGSFKPHSNHSQPVERYLQVKHDQHQEIEVTINGDKHTLWVMPHELLLNVLREKLYLTGAKYGCGLGECSACTVLVDGIPTLACLTLAVAVDGKQIVTVEGLEKPSGELDPLQETFIKYSAFQCGYCTPGFLTTLKGLLAEIPQPSEEEIRDYLKGNRCRCTGYTSIVRAVLGHTHPEKEKDLLTPG